jgi:uncharacterized protein YyaL (SSP411 family)
MREGEIHDHREGGFFRTTTGVDWTQPHREKLLHEHAGLLANYLHAFRLTGRLEYRAMAEEIIAYLGRKLFDAPNGMYFGCEDFLRREDAGASGEDFFTIIDTCIYSDANAQTVCAYLAAAKLLVRDDCEAAACRILEFLWRECRTDEDGIFHYHDGAPRLPGLLEDQVQVGMAMIEAYLLRGDAKYFERARRCAEFIVSRLKDPSGGYFDCAAGENALRRAPLTDLEQNGAAASFFLRLWRTSHESSDREAARWALDAFPGRWADGGIYAARFGRALLDYLSP